MIWILVMFRLGTGGFGLLGEEVCFLLSSPFYFILFLTFRMLILVHRYEATQKDGTIAV